MVTAVHDKCHETKIHPRTHKGTKLVWEGDVLEFGCPVWTGSMGKLDRKSWKLYTVEV